MEKQKVVLFRHGRPSWEFKWDDNYGGLVYKTLKNTYMLFFEYPADSYKPIWIGRLQRNSWVTWEKEIKAKSIEFCGSRILFT